MSTDASTPEPGRPIVLRRGIVLTIQLNWLQPHEGSIVDFLFRARAFQFDKDTIKI